MFVFIGYTQQAQTVSRAATPSEAAQRGADRGDRAPNARTRLRGADVVGRRVLRAAGRCRRGRRRRSPSSFDPQRGQHPHAGLSGVDHRRGAFAPALVAARAAAAAPTCSCSRARCACGLPRCQQVRRAAGFVVTSEHGSGTAQQRSDRVQIHTSPRTSRAPARAHTLERTSISSTTLYV